MPWPSGFVSLADVYDIDDLARIEHWRPSTRTVPNGGWRAKGAAGALAACLTFGIPDSPHQPQRAPAPIVRIVEPDGASVWPDGEWFRRLRPAGEL